MQRIMGFFKKSNVEDKQEITESKMDGNNSVIKYQDIIPSNLWRFVIDGEDQTENNPLIYDNPRASSPGELGYFKAMETAMLLMQKTLNEPLTIKLIETLHDLAIESVKFYDDINKITVSGIKGIRDTQRGFEFHGGQNITFIGLLEILIRDKTIALIGTNGSQASTAGEMFDEMKADWKKYDRRDIIQENGSKLKTFLTDKLQNLIDEYDTEIKLSDNDLDKIITIAEFVHKANFLHPFHDGNIRTFVFLIANKLLLENGFPPAIFENPNRFDGHSVIELSGEIINGIESTLNLPNIKIKNKFDMTELKQSIIKDIESRIIEFSNPDFKNLKLVANSTQTNNNECNTESSPKLQM